MDEGGRGVNDGNTSGNIDYDELLMELAEAY